MTRTSAARPTGATSPTRPPTKSGSTTCAIGSRSTLDEQVLRPFAAAVIDEADSILIDEARIPLVIAGGAIGAVRRRRRADRLVAAAVAAVDFTSSRRRATWRSRRTAWPRSSGCCRAQSLRRRDISPLHDRRPGRAARARAAARATSTIWCRTDGPVGRRVQGPHRARPALAGGLQTALELKEQRAAPPAGPRPRLDHDGEPGRAVSRRLRHDRHGGDAGERVSRDLRAGGRWRFPPHRPDDPRRSSGRGLRDAAPRRRPRCSTRSAGGMRRGGRCSSAPRRVEESERLSARLRDVPHHVLNARNEEAEAAIVARAGERAR